MTSVPLLLGALAACGLVGAMPALVNALKPRLQELLHLDAERVERLERMQFFLAWVAGMPVAGYLVDRWGTTDVLVIGSVGIAVTLAFFGVTESQRWLGGMSFLLGVATSFLAVATLVLVPHAIPLYPERVLPAQACPAAALNAGFVALGLGSFLPQLVLSRFERWFGLRRALLVLGLASLLPAGLILWAVVSRAPTEAVAPPPVVTASFFFSIPFWLVAFMLLLYLPIESALDIWSEPFLQEIGYQERTARAMLLGFWIAFLLARVAMWYLLGARDEIWLLWFAALISAIVLGNLVGAYGASAGGFGFWLVGACYGPLLPGFLGLLLEVSPTHQQGLALGCVLAVAGLYDALAQPLLRRATSTRPVRASMRIPLLMTLLMLAPLLVLGLVAWPATR